MVKFKKLSLIIIAGFVIISMIQPAIAGKGTVNLNTATKTELVTLKFVGDKLADRIIEYRKAQPFASIEEIMKVKGVGQKILDANKDVMTVKDK